MVVDRCSRFSADCETEAKPTRTVLVFQFATFQFEKLVVFLHFAQWGEIFFSKMYRQIFLPFIQKSRSLGTTVISGTEQTCVTEIKPKCIWRIYTGIPAIWIQLCDYDACAACHT